MIFDIIIQYIALYICLLLIYNRVDQIIACIFDSYYYLIKKKHLKFILNLIAFTYLYYLYIICFFTYIICLIFFIN